MFGVKGGANMAAGTRCFPTLQTTADRSCIAIPSHYSAVNKRVENFQRGLGSAGIVSEPGARLSSQLELLYHFRHASYYQFTPLFCP